MSRSPPDFHCTWEQLGNNNARTPGNRKEEQPTEGKANHHHGAQDTVCKTYEWVWTVKAGNVPKLREALGNPPDLTEALLGRFSGKAAAELWPFLCAKGIPCETWSRVGD